jgi:hypothetical protein
MGGVIFPALFIGFIVHPNSIHIKYYSSRYYSLKTKFITTLSLKIPIVFTIILFILFISALFIILHGVNFFLFVSFVPSR